MTDPATEATYEFPLNDAQKSLLQRQSAMPDVPLNVAQYAILEGPLDVEAFREASRHEIRATRAMQIRFEARHDGVVGIFDSSLHDFIDYLDVRGDDDPMARALETMRADAAQSVDPMRDRLARGMLIQLSETTSVLYQRTHHLLTDGVAALDNMVIGLRRIAARLQGDPLPPRPVPDLRTPARADADYRAVKRFQTDRAYWRDTLDGVGGGTPSLSLRVGPPSILNRSASDALSESTMTVLRRAADTHRTTLPALIAAGLAGYLARLTDGDDVTLDLAVAARTVAALRTTPLPTLNFVPVRTGVGAQGTVETALRTTQGALMGALRHQRYRRDDIVADHGGQIGGPVLNIMLFDRQIRFGDVTATLHSLTTGPVDDLSVNIYPDATTTDPLTAGTLIVELEANPHRYDAAEVTEHHRQLLAAVDAFAHALTEHPDTLIDDLPLQVSTPEPPSQPAAPQVLGEILDAAVAKFGDLPAVDGVRAGEPALTFAELDSRATDIAAALRERGARPGQTVAIALPRGVEQVIAWWAVARTGAAILLIDPGLMRTRVDTILRVARPVVVLGDGDLDSLRNAEIDWQSTDVDSPGLDDVAYVVFTSGTTGEPKGIAVPHRGLANLIRDAAEMLDGGTLDGAAHEAGSGPGRLAGVASPAFDIAHFEMLACAGLGYTLVPMPEIDATLGASLVEHGVTHLYATPSLIARIPTEQLPRVVGTIGETLPPATANQVSAHRLLRNTYGPAEATLYATVAHLDAPVPTDRPTSIGAAVDGMSVYLLDHRLRPAPPGALGEIYLAGSQLALGYLGQMPLTAARFVACPWAPSARMYRTGDLARLAPATGLLEFHGRNDDQISVHGVRIEPAEIERTAADVDGVDAAVAVAVTGAQGTTIDVAITSTAGIAAEALSATVRHHLFATLPSMMWPRRVVVIDQLPLGTTGKLDRRAVAARLADLPVAPIAYAAPTTEHEHLVAAVVSDVLDVDEPSMLASIIDLGGTSLSVMEIVGRLGSAAGRVLTIADVTAATTLRDVARQVDEAPPVVEPGPHAPRVSRPQQELWLAHRIDPTNTAYHLPVHLEFAPGIGAEVVTAALADVAARHDALRTLFDAGEDGTAVARVLDADAVRAHLPVTTGTLDDAGIRAAATAPFDLTAAPAWRAVLDTAASVSGDTPAAAATSMVLVAHHIAVDGASIPILVRDFLTAITARRDGHPPVWADAPVSSAAPEVADDAESHHYWASVLNGAPEAPALPEPPLADTGPAITGPVSHQHRRIDGDLRTAITRAAAAAGATPFTLLRVALAAVLARYTGTDDSVVSVPTSGRTTTNDLHRVGMYVRTLPIRTAGVLDRPVGQALADADAALTAAVGHAAAAPPGLADVLITANAALPDISAVGGDIGADVLRTAHRVDIGAARTALEFAVTDTADHLDIRMTVAERRVDPAAATLMLDALVDTVTRLAAATAGTTIVDCLPPPPLPTLLPRSTPIRDPIRALIPHTASNPDAIAVIDVDGAITYAQLAARARASATDLLRAGVRDGDRVALLMGRTADTVVAMVGVLMAGAAYVPVDPDHPQARIDELLAAVAPAAIIRDGLRVERLSPGADRTPGDAYVIHTSGSTGVPKGVSVTRENLAAMLGAALDSVGAGPADVWSWTHSYTFDFSVWEIFGALASGGRIVVLDRATARDPRLLTDALATHGVTMLSQTPTAFARLTDEDIAATLHTTLPALRCVVFGGEALHPTTLQAWAATHPGTRLVNMYGITETTVHLTAADVDVTDERSIIGAALNGVRWSVRDARLRRVPPGGRGELYVCGQQVSRGYLHAPALTAARFVADPERPGARMYRTGDLVRILPDGRLAHLGRSDEQIQLRGHRIEPGEIVAVLRGVPGVTDARVLIDGAGAGSGAAQRPGDERLLGFVTSRDHSVDEAVLLAACAARLPAYAIPARIGVVETWPLTGSGKLDRAALLPAALPADTATGAEPTADERRVAAVIAEIIGVDAATLGPGTNFFAAGGNSLSAARLAARLSTPDRTVSVGDVFARSTVAALARHTGDTDTGHLTVAAASPINEAQRALWHLNRAEPSDAYHLAVRLRLTAPTERAVLEAALRDVAERHEVLRTIYPDIDGEPGHQVIGTAQMGPLLDADEHRAVSEPFDLSAGPGWRATASGTGDRVDSLTLVAHHMIVDGASIPILLNDFRDAVRARVQGQEPAFVGTAPTADGSARHVPDTDPHHWQTYLDGAPTRLPLPEPADPQPTGLTAGPAVTVDGTVGASTVAALTARAAAAGTTVSAALWVALAATLAEITDTDDLVIAIPVSGRDDPATHGLVGMFARTVPVRAAGLRALSVTEALRQVHTAFASAIVHASTAPTTLPAVLLDHDTDLAPTGIAELAGIAGIAEVQPLPTGRARTTVEVTVRDTADDMTVTLAAARHHVDAAATPLLLQRFLAVIDSLAHSPDETDLIDCLPPAEPIPVPEAVAEPGDVIDLIRAAADLDPDATALIGTDATLTYAELISRATEFASLLGVRPGDRVGVCLPPGIDAVVAMVGTLIADAVYVPLDPDHPRQRTELLVARAGVSLIVEDGTRLTPVTAGAATPPPCPGDAYIIHTSGSTGTPKGVIGTRAGMAAMLAASREVIAPRRSDVWACAHAPTFDASVWEIFGALTSGGSVVMVDRDDLLDPHRFAGILDRHRVSILAQTPTAFARLTDPAVAAATRLPALRSLILGGESADPTTLRQWAATHPGVRLLTMYGPTETTVQVTCAEIDVDDHRPIIGRPLAGVGVAVLDGRGRPVPLAGWGELYVTGAQLARGYVGSPTQTAARFVASVNGRRCYRTGDVVRRMPDGHLAYLGRTDDQVQIRGFRIEPAEIAAALRSVDGVTDARVLVSPGARPGDEQLVGFVTGSSPMPDEQRLRARCAELLPAHEIPARISGVDEWPMTTNGKLDTDALLRSLPAPGRVGGIGREPTGRERSVAQAMAATIARESLDHPVEFGADTNFFAVGGNSLSAARLAALLSAGGRHVPVAEVFAAPTVAELAATLDRLDATTADEPALPDLATHRAEPDRLPLTPEQEDLWLRWRAQPDVAGYLMSAAVPVDVLCLGGTTELWASMRAVIPRYDALRTSFPETDDGPYQRLWPEQAALDHLGPATPAHVDDIDEALTTLTTLATPIDLGAELPWRIRLVECDGRDWLLVVAHHIVADGETLEILRSAMGARPGVTQAPAVGYRQYTLWRHESLAARRTELTAFWRTVFTEPLEPLRLPEIDLDATASDASASDATAHDVTASDVTALGPARRSQASLSPATTARLDELATTAHSTPFIVLHTALALVLARQSGNRSVTVGTAVSGRVDPRLADVPGVFARAVPLHTRIDLAAPFTALLAEVTATDVGAIAHADLPLSEITALADPTRERAGRPLFDVVLGAVPDDIAAQQHALRESAPLFGIDVMTHRADDRIHLTLTCGARVAEQTRLDALTALLTETLERAIARPDLLAGELVSGASPVNSAAPQPETLSDLLNGFRSAGPDAIVVDDAERALPGCGPSLRADQLDRAADALAWRLVECGAGPGSAVVSHLPRSVYGVLATLAIARTGAAVVNVDPTDPERRRAGLIERVGAAVVLTLAAGQVPADVTAAGTEVIVVDDPGLYLAAPPRFTDADRTRPLRIDDPAYLTFTSGTTGVPKGVVVTHRGLGGWARETVRRLHLAGTDRVLHTYAVGFDAQLMGLVPVLAAGACVVVCPAEVVGGDELARRVEQAGVSVLLSTPSVLATTGPHAMPGLRHLAVGGEALPPSLVRGWSARMTLSNEYGPTETTVAVTSARYSADSDRPGGGEPTVTIGAPIPGVSTFILDEQLRPVPEYTIGELYVAGTPLAQGYLNDPGATAAAFVAGPDGTRMYRTGDLVHRRADGELVIHGRRDEQLKLRGIRIEPAEVEAALTSLPAVASAAVGVRTNRSGEPVLLAWVSTAADVTSDGRQIRDDARTVLPRSLVPATVVVVDALPIGPTGKVDRRALRVPEVLDAVAPDTAVQVASALDTTRPEITAAAPPTEFEDTVAAVFAEVLAVDRAALDADADFFALGGTSLSATQVTSRLTDRLSHDVKVAELFTARTVGALAASVANTATGPALTRPSHRTRPESLPLAYPQRRIWIQHRFDPTSTAYHVPVVARLTGDIDVERLQAALIEVLSRHDSLRSRFPDSDAGPVQELIDPDDVWTVHVDDPRAAIRAEITRPFDLENDAPVHATLMTTDGDDVYLVLTLHHIAVDGWSVRLLLGEVAQAYQSEDVADPGLTYADFTQWQMEFLGDPAEPSSLFARQLAHWTDELAGVRAPLRLPGVSPADVSPGGRVAWRLDGGVSASISAAAQQVSATVFQAVHAALASVLAGWTGSDDVVIGVPVHGRSAPEWESVIGMFVNTVAVRTRVAGDATIRDAIAASRDAAVEASAHADVPYEVVARAVRPDARDGRDPLTSVLLVGQDVVPAVTEPIVLNQDGQQLTVQPVDLDGDEVAAKLDAELVVSTVDGRLELTVVYSSRVSRELAEALLGGVVAALSAVGEGLDRPFPGVVAPVERAPNPVEWAPDHVEWAPDSVEWAPGVLDGVAAAMAETLGVDATGIDENSDFFELGGTSLSATHLASTIETRFGVRVPTKMIFDHPTVGGLAGAVGRGLDAASASAPAGSTDEVGAAAGGEEAPTPAGRAGEERKRRAVSRPGEVGQGGDRAALSAGGGLDTASASAPAGSTDEIGAAASGEEAPTPAGRAVSRPGVVGQGGDRGALSAGGGLDTASAGAPVGSTDEIGAAASGEEAPTLAGRAVSRLGEVGQGGDRAALSVGGGLDTASAGAPAGSTDELGAAASGEEAPTAAGRAGEERKRRAVSRPGEVGQGGDRAALSAGGGLDTASASAPAGSTDELGAAASGEEAPTAAGRAGEERKRRAVSRPGEVGQGGDRAALSAGGGLDTASASAPVGSTDEVGAAASGEEAPTPAGRAGEERKRRAVSRPGEVGQGAPVGSTDDVSTTAGWADHSTSGRDLPLAPTQRRMWVAAHTLGDIPMYVVPVVIPVPEGTTMSRVAAAVDALIARHTALRTTYPSTPDGPRQHVLDDWRPDLEWITVDAVTPDTITELMRAPFDLTTAPPVRVYAVIGSDEHGIDVPVVVAVIGHHIAIDGESAAILADELTALLTSGELHTNPTQFTDVTAALVDAEQRDRAAQLDFWTDTLDGYTDDLGLVATRPAVRDYSTAIVHRTLDADLHANLADTARRHRVTGFQLMHAALAWALAVQAGTDDVAIATTTSLRRPADWRSAVGMLVSTVLLRNTIRPDATVGSYLGGVRDAALAALDHALVAFDDVVAHVGARREPGRHPLTQVALTVGGTGYLPESDEFESPHSEFDIRVTVSEHDGTHQIAFVYATDILDAAVMESLADRMTAALRLLTADAGRALNSAELLSRHDTRVIGRALEAPEPAHPPTLAEMFAAPAGRYASWMAIDDGRRALTYAQLDAWVSATATALTHAGLRAGDAVAVRIPRSIESMVAVRAIARIGAVYVPIEVSYPSDRIDGILEVTGATAITICDIPARPIGDVPPVPDAQVSVDDLAYVITTSGTTGRPNAVGVTHRGLHRLSTVAPIDAFDRVAAMVSPGFDPSIMEMILPLSVGATLVVVPPELVAGHDLTAWLAKTGVTVFIATPSVLATLDPEPLRLLRQVFVGGEALPADLADRWAAHCTLVNVYGPTEATVAATAGRHRPQEPVSIGTPVDGVGALVLDRALRPVPLDVTGELYLVGSSLARGYLGDPGLTAARFVAAPDGRRMYRTGDLVRWEQSGDDRWELAYVARADRQLKIRGQRVEPAEVDAVLRRAGASQAATVLRESPGGPALVAYAAGDDLDVDALIQVCRRELPRHMVPARLIVVDEIPRTTSGKIDESALPQPHWPTGGRAATTPLEGSVLDAFSAVLGAPIGMDDDFFSAGGNSLGLVAVRDEITQRTGWRPTMAALFAAPTPAAVAALLNAPGGGDERRAVELSAPGPDDRPILWVVHLATGLVTPYRELAAALAAYRVVGLQLPELLDGAALPSSMSEIARRHVAAIRSVQPTGPYRVAGWSVGGNIAHEIARQISDAGGVVDDVVLLDPRSPDEMTSAPADEVADLAPELVAAVRSHRAGSVTAGKVLYISASDTPGPAGWDRYLDGEVRVVPLPVAHREFGDPGVMRRIAHILEEEM
ncbi:amino acid adenylation domain-containing protein [Gordonia oleivorans]|uniref:amino acid adenylation domain-containing protein n=1 Tax=Gordonia oleivorans TaxID=3156618 RepID=UPI003CCDE2F2